MNDVPGRSFQIRAFMFFVLLTLGAGVFVWVLGGISGYGDVAKPPLALPGKVFVLAWIVLHALIGVAAYLVWNANDIDGGRVLRLYLVQLALGSLWLFFFLRLKWRLFSFFWALLLLAVASLVMTGFKYIRKPAYLLTIPYFAWNIYLAYLNLGVYLLN